MCSVFYTSGVCLCNHFLLVGFNTSTDSHGVHSPVAGKQVMFFSLLNLSPLVHITASFVAPLVQQHSCQYKRGKHRNFLVQADPHTMTKLDLSKLLPFHSFSDVLWGSCLCSDKQTIVFVCLLAF